MKSHGLLLQLSTCQHIWFYHDTRQHHKYHQQEAQSYNKTHSALVGSAAATHLLLIVHVRVLGDGAAVLALLLLAVHHLLVLLLTSELQRKVEIRNVSKNRNKKGILALIIQSMDRR